jgi:VIT1/CCC1 family predicted Fe2+/Mn2+ transporter
MPVGKARIVSALITLMLLAALGFGRARLGGRPVVRTMAETAAVGVAAAMAGVLIGVALARLVTP